MGNSASSAHRGQHDDTVDYGHLYPQGVYTGPRDWNHSIVTQLIIERRLAPFYRPLEEYEDDWDDEHILAARKEFPEGDAAAPESAPRLDHPIAANPRTVHPHKRSPASKEIVTAIPEASVYRGAIECPICFLYYPPNINHSRCCDQAICTECFVQIKRNEPTTTHLVSEPAACPYCVQDNFGITYNPPLWRAGIGSEGSGQPNFPMGPRSPLSMTGESTPSSGRRRKSFGHDSHDVVTIDHIRPDWEAKLAAVRAAVTRRANRRIIMRQVGDRLIPVGVTSGRVHGLEGGEQGEPTDGASEGRSSRRSRRRQQQQQDLNQLLGSMGLGGQDLEDLMVMEAMRLSLLEHEEAQRREAQNRKPNGSDDQQDSSAAGQPSSSESQSPTSAVPIESPRAREPQVAFGSPDSNSGNDNGARSFDTHDPAHTTPMLSPLGSAVVSAGAILALPSQSSSSSGSISRATTGDRSPSPQPRRSGESMRSPGQRPSPPFSTLSAAIAAHSTASAFLSPVDVPSQTLSTPDSADDVVRSVGCTPASCEAATQESALAPSDST